MTQSHEPQRMHAISDDTRDTVDEVLHYARRRALFANVPLDKAMSPRDLERLASGSITADGIGARRAIGLFENVLAPACISTDHPGYLSFIPSAPTKAALAFDVVVSASAIYAGSWMEGAGAVFAENEVLHWLAQRVRTARGRRRRLRAGRHDRQPLRAGRRLGMSRAAATARPASPTRRAGSSSAAPKRTRRSRPPRRSWTWMSRPPLRMPPAACTATPWPRALDEHGAAVFAVVATGGTTNFGIVDDIASIAAVTRDRDVWLHIDGAYGLAAMLVDRMRPAFAGVGRRRLGHRRPAQVAVRTVRRVRADLPRPVGRAGRSHAEGRVPRHAHRVGRLESVRPRDPAHPACPGPSAVVLARHARHRALPGGRRQRHPARPAHRRRDHAHATGCRSCAIRSCRWSCSAARAGRPPTTRRGRTGCWRSRRRSWCRVRTRARRSCASRSSAR